MLSVHYYYYYNWLHNIIIIWKWRSTLILYPTIMFSHQWSSISNRNTELTISCLTEKRQPYAPSVLRRMPHIGRDNSRWRQTIAVIIASRKSNKNWPVPQYMLKMLASWPNALSIPVEQKRILWKGLLPFPPQVTPMPLNMRHTTQRWWRFETPLLGQAWRGALYIFVWL